jgi:hypothetical protein
MHTGNDREITSLENQDRVIGEMKEEQNLDIPHNSYWY